MNLSGTIRDALLNATIEVLKDLKSPPAKELPIKPAPKRGKEKKNG